jgi:hypothetical protein
VAERRLEALPLAGGEPVEGDGEVVDADARHGGSFVLEVRLVMLGSGRSGAEMLGELP